MVALQLPPSQESSGLGLRGPRRCIFVRGRAAPHKSTGVLSGEWSKGVSDGVFMFFLLGFNLSCSTSKIEKSAFVASDVLYLILWCVSSIWFSFLFLLANISAAALHEDGSSSAGWPSRVWSNQTLKLFGEGTSAAGTFSLMISSNLKLHLQTRLSDNWVCWLVSFSMTILKVPN